LRRHRAYLQRPAAEALVKAHKWLATIDLGITVLDAYRPWNATKLFWEAVPEHQKEFVANPELGSVHNRGCAVDVTLYRLSTNETIEMVSGYDEMTDRAYRSYAGGTSHQRWSRRVLRIAMERFGFEVLPNEHWHFNFKHFTTWPALNIPFSELNGL
jgi:D-alanyl-D-alanine dipeptidase